MPKIIIKNDTEVPLHIALRHISPIHFVNNVGPGEEAVFPSVGRVWFTIEARIARRANAEQNRDDEITTNTASATQNANDANPASTSGGSKIEKVRNLIDKKREEAFKNNEYTMFQAVAAPVAVSVAALSLGAGAIYVGMAASAAGSMSAALSTISTQISTAAASQAPTARRLYKYAKKGQNVVQIGQILGIGGGALLGSKVATNQEKEDAIANVEREHDFLTGQQDIERIRKVKEILTNLVERYAIRSHGWYMNKDRKISIRGGPRAAEVEEWLIIETDTNTPFEVISQDPNDKPDPKGQEEAMKGEEGKEEEKTNDS